MAKRHPHASMPPPRTLNVDERREATRMLDAAPNRTGRLLVLLVEFDGLPLERAAAALMLTEARAREQLASLRTIARQADRQQRKATQLAELAGVSRRMRSKNRIDLNGPRTKDSTKSINPLDTDPAPGAEKASYEHR